MKVIEEFITASALCLILLLLFSGCGSKAEPQLATDYNAMRDKVIKEARAGKIQPDASGVATLPSDLQALSKDGHIYISNDEPFGLRIAFKMQAGAGHSMAGFLYCESPLPAGSRKVRVGPVELMLRRKLDSHWYEASTQSL